MPKVTLLPAGLQPALKRVLVMALVALPVVIAAAAPFGPEHAAGAAAGGLLILLCGLWTLAAVAGLAGDEAAGMLKKLWLRLAWRFVLLGAALYAILQAPWLRLESFIAGLSLFVPAVAIEAAIELTAPKS